MATWRSVRVCALAFVALSACASHVQAQEITAFHFVSQSGDFVGNGEEKSYTEPATTFTVARTFNGGVRVSVQPPDYPASWWDLEFAAAANGPLAEGSYTAARRTPFQVFNGMDFSGTGRGCNALSGRFEVLELEYAGDGSVSKLAIDFEQHCEGLTAAAFGAIRYHSRVASLDPFGGDFPHFRLSIDPPTHGAVTGAGIDCGGGGSTCVTEVASVSSIALTATPDAGYVFAGWSGDCFGAPATSVNVNGMKACGARFEPVDLTPRTFLRLESEAGDLTGDGRTRIYSTGNSVWTASSFSASSVAITVAYAELQSNRWQLNFSAPAGQTLQPGTTYTHAVGTSFLLTSAGLTLTGGGCSSGLGRFTILEFVRSSDGTVQRFAADLEFHCNNAAPALFGAVRYNSTITSVVPFGGQYPAYTLDIDPPVNGSISCDGGSPCAHSFGGVTTVALQADPDPGYIFAGWTGDCTGLSPVSLFVNGPKRCGVVFEPEAGIARTLARWSSGSGDVVGQGRDKVFSAQATTWQLVPGSGPAGIGLMIDAPTETSDTRWDLRFVPPPGQTLTAGTLYVHAVRASFTRLLPGMEISNLFGGFCSLPVGRFLVRTIRFAPDGTLREAAIDYEQHCNNAEPALIGVLRYNSSEDLTPFHGDYGVFRLTMARPQHGRISGSGLDCGTNTTACTIQLSTATTASFSATPDPGYILAGWTGDCHGGSSAQLFVNGPKQCEALFETGTPPAPRTMLRLTSEAGEQIAGGRPEVFSASNSVWEVGTPSLFNGAASGVNLSVYGAGDSSEQRWFFSFSAPPGDFLRLGAEYVVDSTSFSPTAPRMFIFADSGCGDLGKFTVRELVFDAITLRILHLAIDFEHHCNSMTSPALIGSIQYNSTVDMPAMALDRFELRFAGTIAGARFASVTAPQIVRLTQADAGTVTWTATPSVPWITVTPSSGTGSAALTVSVALTVGVPLNGTVQGFIKITAVGSKNLVPSVSVALTTVSAGASVAPFGVFETPLNNATGVTGSIAVTGWALDDIGVTRVRILRDGVPGEAPLVFIGNASFVDGARPDVAAKFPSLPRASRAGWGYLLLTNFLPSLGNGTFVLHAIADDADGHSTELGTRTISVANAGAQNPFGAIDTPGQGETVSGVIENWGWVLSRGPALADPLHGGAVNVVIDGVVVGHPVLWTARADISGLFPVSVYPGVVNAVGRFILDTTTLSNGVHEIAWGVTDDQGRSAGVGSRFFTVSNGAGVVLESAAGSFRLKAEATGLRATRAEAAGSRSFARAIVGRRGFSLDTPFREYRAKRDGVITIQSEELDRIELQVGVVSSAYLLSPDGRHLPLPIGSHLDAATGTFTWQPGAGFVHGYDLIFERDADDVRVRIVLNAKGSGRVGAQVVIDTPSVSHVGRVFRPGESIFLAGWAADLDSDIDSGVDTVHVWAYPVVDNGTRHGDPIWVGVATSGGTRPDVGAVYGERFTKSGYGIYVSDLAPGTYDLAVFARSTVVGDFAPASTVRVTIR